MPARVHGHDVGLALAERAGRAGPAAQLDIAGLVEFGFVEPDQRLQIAAGELVEQAFVPVELRVGIAVGAGKMRHPSAREDHGFQPHRGDRARHRLAEGIAALHGRLRRQIGVDVDRQHRAGMAEVGERNADGIVDLRRRAEGRIEVLPIKLAHKLEGDLARDLPVEFPAGEIPARLAADMHGEGRRRGVEKLLGVIVGEDDPKVWIERPQAAARCRPPPRARARRPSCPRYRAS